MDHIFTHSLRREVGKQTDTVFRQWSLSGEKQTHPYLPQYLMYYNKYVF